ncbi:MAG: YraN family protein [Burkholderiales bacterium]|nr:YraN family protein [Burkholderiales bacterium]
MSRAERSATTRGAARGERAEALAADYLMRQGLTLVARNFRTRLGEIDLIARDRDVLVFVEVRLRSSSAFGDAAASITHRKRARLAAAARTYFAMIGHEPTCRFDAILLDGLDPERITWERNVDMA